MKKTVLYSLLALMLSTIVGYTLYSSHNELRDSFISPPEDIKPGIYWYWMNEHISKEGITKDLEAMKRVGIGEAFIGNIYEGGEPGAIKTMSDEWLDCMQHAIREGSRIGVRISIFNSPGWSQSGGPWVKEEEAMRFLTYTDTIVDGGSTIDIDLPKHSGFSQDVAILAVPYTEEILKPSKITIVPTCIEPNKLFDGDKKSKSTFKTGSRDAVSIELTTAEEFLCRSLTLYPTGIGFDTECELFAWDKDKYVSVSKVFFDRSNTSLQLGPTPDGKLVMSFEGVISNRFKITMNNLPTNFELSEVELSDGVKVEKVTEKSLSKMPNTPGPAWDAYRWKTQRYDKNIDFVQDIQVINLTEHFKDGKLKWEAPNGKWKILRYAMKPTYTTNTPAAPAARGLEIDKLSQKASQKHFESFVGKIISGLSTKEKKSLHRIIVDSYEVGPQNWTDMYRYLFILKMGYDPIPYLPILSGEVIGSVDASDRFLWDMRRVVADLVAEEYVGGLRAIANENGLKLWSENYGHWGFPSEFLYYGSKSDEIGGEFWAGSGPGMECKLASSACNVYGKNEVFAESYTAGGNNFKWHPATLKQKGDWSYTEGINSVILHVYIHQPYSEKVPGVNAWFGIEYNRHNTWFELSKGWIDYQRRCSYLLQQGLPVRDLCVFFGEDTPQMNYWIDPSLSKGYSFDLINGDAIINRLSVKDGNLVLPNGLSYGALLLPPLETMRPEVLSSIRSLVEQGATIIANNAPVKSPSLANYPNCDIELQKDVDAIFPQNGEKEKRFGKGVVYTLPVNEALSKINYNEDVSGIENNDIKWTHRKAGNVDIYFITNQGNDNYNGNLTFRVKGKKPEFWSAVDGSMRPADAYECSEKGTTVSVKLDPTESVFVVFDKKADKSNSSLPDKEKTARKLIKSINSSWTVNYKNEVLSQDFTVLINSLFDWKESLDPRIKYFSGTAKYLTQFEYSSSLNESVFIHFDDIKVIGRLFINGKEIGTMWAPPYELEITAALIEGENTIEMEVSNLWVNQLIKQQSLPKTQRTTWTLIDAANADQELESSGIIGKCYLFTN